MSVVELRSGEDAMKKGSHFWNRREFNVAPNGFFTVQKAAGWFAAWRLPAGFRYPASQSRATVAPPVAERAETRFQILAPVARDRQLQRSLLIVIAAALITFLLLLWIMHPNFVTPH